ALYLARGGQNLLGSPFSAIPATAYGTHRTYHSSLRTACGVIFTYFAGRTLRMVERPAVPIQARGPARAALLFPHLSWPAFKRSSTKRPAAHRVIPLPSTISSPQPNTARAATVPAIQVAALR